MFIVLNAEYDWYLQPDTKKITLYCECVCVCVSASVYDISYNQHGIWYYQLSIIIFGFLNSLLELFPALTRTYTYYQLLHVISGLVLQLTRPTLVTLKWKEKQWTSFPGFSTKQKTVKSDFCESNKNQIVCERNAFYFVLRGQTDMIIQYVFFLMKIVTV